MTLRQHTIEKKKDTHKQIWEWEETPELLTAIEQLQKSSQVVGNITDADKPIHIGNTNFALYKPRLK